MDEPIRCLDCGYVLWGLPAGRCPECGRDFDPENPNTYSTHPPFVRWRYWLPGFLLAVGGGALFYILLILLAGWGWAVTLAAPFALGAAIGYGCRTKAAWGLVLLCLAAVIIIVTTLFTLSFVGIFCGTVLAAVAMVPALIGVGIGVALRRMLKASKWEQRWYLPLLTLAVATAAAGVADRLTHRPYAIETVVTSVEIPAPVGRAWNAVMFYEEVHHPPPWLLRWGLPKPLYTSGSVAHVGDTKTCIYTKGHLTKRVTERDLDRRLAFDIIEQDRIENHSIRLTDGSFDFTPEGADLTRVDLTTRYEPKLGPRWIWRPAELLAVHTLHDYVLEGMRRKAAGEP
jgi:rRNA maturation protein Nop10